MKLAVFSVSWNPTNSVNVDRTVRRFTRNMEKEQMPAIIAKPKNMEPFLFQKEAILNQAIKTFFTCGQDGTPSSNNFDAIAWLDADIEFLRYDWYQGACDMLEEYSVIQMFEICHLLDQHGRVMDPSPGYQFQLSKNMRPKAGQGYAWAMRRELFDAAGGLFDLNVTGGGDAMMAAAFNNRTEDFAITKVSDPLRQKWDAWRHKFQGLFSGGVGILPGDIVHFYHGAVEHRQYTQRTHLLKTHQYNPDVDVERDGNGLLKWTGANPRLERAVRDMFLSRKEDQ